MTIKEKIESAIGSRDDIQDAITAKGVTVDNTVPLSSYASKISEIQANGGGITPGVQLWGNDFDGTSSVNGNISIGTIGDTRYRTISMNGSSVLTFSKDQPTAGGKRNLSIYSDNINISSDGFSVQSKYGTIVSSVRISETNIHKNSILPLYHWDTKDESGDSPFYLTPITDASYPFTRTSRITIRPEWLSTQIANSPAIADAITTHNDDATAHSSLLTTINSVLNDKEDKSNKVAISSTSTATQYPNAKSVWDLVQDTINQVPAGGLKVPISIGLESQLPPIADRVVGDYYYIQNMDITAPGRTGRAWVNLNNETDPNSKQYFLVWDQYQSMDGVSITQTGGGEWEVNQEWLSTNMPAPVETDPVFTDWRTTSHTIAIGSGSSAATGGVSIGSDATMIRSFYGIALGSSTMVEQDASGIGTHAVAIGFNSSVIHANYSVAIGSKATVVKSDITDFDGNTPVVSFGSTADIYLYPTKRRLINVADGIHEYDAVNYGQLSRLSSNMSTMQHFIDYFYETQYKLIELMGMYGDPFTRVETRRTYVRLSNPDGTYFNIDVASAGLDYILILDNRNTTSQKTLYAPNFQFSVSPEYPYYIITLHSYNLQTRIVNFQKIAVEDAEYFFFPES